MKKIILLTLLLSGSIIAQDNRIAQFTVWRMFPGQENNFQTGVKRHFQWHKSNNDSWDWYGWYIVSGPRTGYFVDATFDHYWSDFDRQLDPVGHRNDEFLNIYPHAETTGVTKSTFLREQSNYALASFRSRYLRVVSLKVSDVNIANRVLERLRSNYRNSPDVTSFLVFKTVDGSDGNELTLMIGFENWDQFGRSEALHEQLIAAENALRQKVILSARFETWRFQPDMSYLAGANPEQASMALSIK